MKKLIAGLLAVCVCFALTACGASEEAASSAVAADPSSAAASAVESVVEASDVAEPAGEVVGGYTVVDAEAATLPQEAQEAFDKAVEGWVGTDLKPVALVGTQTVSGTNYAFLAKATTVTAEPVLKNVLVIVYADLEGNAEILNVADLDGLDSYGTTAEASLTGGWEVADITGSNPSQEDGDLLELAQGDDASAGYSLVAPMATQVVSGTNHRYFCREVISGEEPVTGLCVVTVYEDLDGNAEILDVQPFDIAAFNE